MKRELAALAVIALLTFAAVMLGNHETTPVTPSGAVPVETNPYDPDARPREIVYREEGGLSPFQWVEVRIDDAPQATVTYKINGKAEETRRHPLDRAAVVDLFARFERVGFLDVVEDARSRYIADQQTVTVAYRCGEKNHKVQTNGQRRATRDLEPILAYFRAVRKAVTPEPIVSGD